MLQFSFTKCTWRKCRLLHIPADNDVDVLTTRTVQFMSFWTRCQIWSNARWSSGRNTIFWSGTTNTHNERITASSQFGCRQIAFWSMNRIVIARWQQQWRSIAIQFRTQFGGQRIVQRCFGRWNWWHWTDRRMLFAAFGLTSTGAGVTAQRWIEPFNRSRRWQRTFFGTRYGFLFWHRFGCGRRDLCHRRCCQLIASRWRICQQAQSRIRRKNEEEKRRILSVGDCGCGA